jgi:catechol 2,3-dioxygenase-like lactoylglutathione lyase family enzyme
VTRLWKEEVVQMFEGRAVPTIAVSDMERARKFYEGTLGLKVLDERSDGTRYEAADGTWFLVYPSQFAGTAKSTYMSFEVSDLEKSVQELQERGVTFEEYDMPNLKTVNGIAEIQGVKGAWFKDPDGNILAVGEMTA